MLSKENGQGLKLKSATVTLKGRGFRADYSIERLNRTHMVGKRGGGEPIRKVGTKASVSYSPRSCALCR